MARHNQEQERHPRQLERWSEGITESTPTRVKLSQGSKDTDTWESIFVFECQEGRWFLVESGGGGG